MFRTSPINSFCALIAISQPIAPTVPLVSISLWIHKHGVTMGTWSKCCHFKLLWNQIWIWCGKYEWVILESFRIIVPHPLFGIYAPSDILPKLQRRSRRLTSFFPSFQVKPGNQVKGACQNPGLFWLELPKIYCFSWFGRLKKSVLKGWQHL